MDRMLLGEYIGDDKKILESVCGGAITDIKKALIEPAPDLGIFILGACFIDAMAGFRYGVTKEDEKGVGDRFKNFITLYLPEEYRNNKGDDFYKSLRCGLVHNYVEQRGKYAFFSDNRREDLHHGSNDKGQIIIHRRRFVGELVSAYKKFTDDILRDKKVFRLAMARYDALGLMDFPMQTIYPKNDPARDPSKKD